MRWKAVIFDMDGTLLETELMVIEAGLEALTSLGLPPRRDLLESLVGLVTAQAAPIFEDAYGPDFSMQELEKHWDRHLAGRFNSRIPLRPGVERLLARLDELRLPRALATNSRTAVAHNHLQKAGIASFFDTRHVHGRDHVASPKPAPDLFLHAARGLGIAPEDCLVFEDSDPGATGAVAAGMTCILVPDQREPHFTGPHLRAPDIISGARLAGLME